MISDLDLIVKVLCSIYVCMKKQKQKQNPKTEKNCKELSHTSKIKHYFIDTNNVKWHRVLLILI